MNGGGGRGAVELGEWRDWGIQEKWEVE